jgi:hypothetical protein
VGGYQSIPLSPRGKGPPMDAISAAAGGSANGNVGHAPGKGQSRSVFDLDSTHFTRYQTRLQFRDELLGGCAERLSRAQSRDPCG